MPTLILFDIDGTLLDCGPKVRVLFEAAMVEAFGTAGLLQTVDFAGKTDPGIVLEALTPAGLSGEAVAAGLPSMKSSYLTRLAAALDRQGMRLLPGVEEVLTRLARRSDVVLALLTGNWEPGARIKLSPFGLNAYFPFGAFGCDGIERAELPPFALERAFRATGRRFLPAETLIVGDSLNDIACAHAHGIPALAVATGRTSAAALAAAGADWVVPDLLAAGEAVALFTD
ncbi:MAG TPA: HAD family hydrolase [Thermoanaerobaculia bacterium]|jgi:phosphoglycolate phosphatase-like HAD superfamily hydrolase|nr:HAD family hydrolase [Thermoanaerobaculia bacterium]